MQRWRVVLDVACGKCGIVQHPTGTIKECPIGGYHVCCQCGEGGGCSLEDGKAFFTAMYVELANPRTQFDVKCTLQYWLAKLGIEKPGSNS